MSGTTTPTRCDQDGPSQRVILVGRGDVETTLRRIETVELHRSRTGPDAIGELASAMDEQMSSTVVVIGAGAVEPDELPSFREAVGAVAPEAVVIDSASLDADAVVDAVRSAGASKAPDSTVDQSSAQASASISADAVGESAIVEMILAGDNPLTVCLETIRAELNNPSVRYRRAASTDPDTDGPQRADVARRGVIFGALSSDLGVPIEALRREADRLARWLTLSDQQRQLRSAAFTDQLTGAWSRRYFEYFLPHAINKARRLRHDVTLMVYDIDNFKSYNDHYGHPAGDEILRQTVRLLMSVIRPTDRVCRIGGDEFAVIFDDPTGPRQGAGHHPRSIAQIASRFQQQICKHRFPKLGAEAPGTLTISGGLATFPWDSFDDESLLERADQLALESKRQGKNAITFGPGARRVCGATFPDEQ